MSIVQKAKNYLLAHEYVFHNKNTAYVNNLILLRNYFRVSSYNRAKQIALEILEQNRTSKRKSIPENSNYFLIAAHSRIHKNVGLKTIPEGTWLLPLAKCLLPAKVSHNREYSTFFHNFEKVKNFVRTHPAGFYGPGDIYQDVMISTKPRSNSNKLVHGVIKLPLPKGSKLSNKTKLLNNYQMQNLSVAKPDVKQGKVFLSEILKNRPGTYVGAFCRVANNIIWEPKLGTAELPSGKKFVSNANLLEFLKKHGLKHAVQAFNLERARGPPVNKEIVRAHIDKYIDKHKPPKVSGLHNVNSNNKPKVSGLHNVNSNNNNS
jgi:hypothetical protein